MNQKCKLSQKIREIDSINEITYSEISKHDEIELDYYNEERFIGFKLVNEDGKFILKVRRDNLPGSCLETYSWPGTKEDYNRFLDQIEDGMNELIPKIFIYLLRN